MDFEEWWENNGEFRESAVSERDAYEAGQQSKQAEIDALKAKIEEIVKLVHDHTPDYWLDNMIQELLK